MQILWAESVRTRSRNSLACVTPDKKYIAKINDEVSTTITGPRRRELYRILIWCEINRCAGGFRLRGPQKFNHISHTLNLLQNFPEKSSQRRCGKKVGQVFKTKISHIMNFPQGDCPIEVASPPCWYNNQNSSYVL